MYANDSRKLVRSLTKNFNQTQRAAESWLMKTLHCAQFYSNCNDVHYFVLQYAEIHFVANLGRHDTKQKSPTDVLIQA